MDNSDKHLLVKIGQYVLIANDNNQVLLLQRERSKNWSLPGGRLDKEDKDWKQSLIREIKEETGLTIKNPQPFEVKLIENPHQTKYCVFFTAKTSDTREFKISEEHSSSEWIGKEGLADLVIDDEPKVREVLEHYFSENPNKD